MSPATILSNTEAEVRSHHKDGDPAGEAVHGVRIQRLGEGQAHSVTGS